MRRKTYLNALFTPGNTIPEQVNNGKLITPADIAALRDGDMDAYDKLYRAWYHPIFFTLTKLTGSEVEAEEIAQDVFTELWLTREKLEPQNKLNTYLYKLVRNSAIDYFRCKRVTKNS